MEYNMDSLNGIYKGIRNDTVYIILFKDGKSSNYIYFSDKKTPPTYGTKSTFTNSWGKYVDAEPHEIASLEESMKANHLVLVEKELSHIPLMF